MIVTKNARIDEVFFESTDKMRIKFLFNLGWLNGEPNELKTQIPKLSWDLELNQISDSDFITSIKDLTEATSFPDIKGKYLRVMLHIGEEGLKGKPCNVLALGHIINNTFVCVYGPKKSTGRIPEIRVRQNYNTMDTYSN